MSGLSPPFHVSLHMRPPGDWPSRRQRWEDRELAVLDIPPAQLDVSFSVSFEEASAFLERLPRFFIEPDGSFVWVSAAAASAAWQLDGMLADRHGRLLFVELKGSCPRDAWEAILAACGLAPQRLVVQFIRPALLVSGDEAMQQLFP